MCGELGILNDLFKKVNEMENKERSIEMACNSAAIDSVGSVLSGIIYFKSMGAGAIALSTAPLLAESSDADVTKMFDAIKRGIGHAGDIVAINLTSKQDQKDRIDATRSITRKPEGNVLILRHESMRVAAAPNVEITLAVYDIDGEYGLLTLLSRR